METLLCRFVKQPRNLIHVISSPNPAANVQVGARKIGAFVEKTEYSAPPSVIMLQFAQTLKCQHRHHERHYCHHDRAILDITGWLSDMHMEAANVLYSEKHFLQLTGSKILSFNRTCPSVSLALQFLLWLTKTTGW